jgi:ABC-type sulfate transport system permease component
VTLPFVVRAVQPVLLELDEEMEEAAASLGARSFAIFRRIVFPNLLPAILSGVALAFARAIGEFGAVVLISGNLPFKTEVSSVYIFQQVESDNGTGAAAVSVLLLLISLAVLLGIGAFGGGGRVTTMSKWALRVTALGYLTALLLIPVGFVFYSAFSDGFMHAWDAVSSGRAVHALELTLLLTAITVPVNTIVGIILALALVRGRFPGAGC